MALEVELPDGSVVEFPDGTDNATMERALSQYKSAPARPATKTAPAKAKSGAWDYNPTGIHALDGITRQAGAVGDSLQHHLVNLTLGIAQGAGHLVNSGVQAVAGGTDYAKSVQANLDAQDAQVRQRETEYQARTGKTAGAYVGATVGEVLPWMTGLGELRAAGMLPRLARTSQVVGLLPKTANVAGKAGLLAAEGAAMGATAPVTEGNYAETKARQVATGAAAAPLLRLGAAGAGAAGRGIGALARYATPAGRDMIANSRIAQIYGADPNIIPQLRQASQTPGFELTPAQALGTPEAVQAERTLRNNGLTAPAFAQRESDNNAALRQQINRIAGSDADMQAARAARKAATAPGFAAAAGAPVDVSKIRSALDALDNSSMGVRPNIRNARQSILAELERRAAPDGTVPGHILHGLRENIGSHLGPMASAQEKTALGPIKTAIVDALDTGVPGSRDTVEAYAQYSRPISDMAAGRRLRDTVDSRGRDAGNSQAVSLNDLRAALARDDKAQYKMSPQARSALEGMLRDAQARSVTSNTVAASGSNTTADLLRGAGSSPAGQRTLGYLSSLVGGVAGGPVGALATMLATEGGVAANKAVMRRVAQKGTSAKAAADAIEAHLARQQRQSLLSGVPQYLLPYSPR